MILDICSQNLAEPDFSISSKELLWGAHFAILKLIQPHRSHPIELKLGRMILDTSPHHGSGGPVGARYLKLSNQFTAISIYPIELKLGMIILDTICSIVMSRMFLGAE